MIPLYYIAFLITDSIIILKPLKGLNALLIAETLLIFIYIIWLD